MSKIAGGGYTALAAASVDVANDVMVIVDVDDTTEDPSGTTHTITPAQLLESVDCDTATTIQPDGTQYQGTANQAADAGHVHPAYYPAPADNGFLAMNAPLISVAGGQTLAAGNLYLQKLLIKQPFTATNLWVQQTTVAAGTSTQSFCGIWNSSGTLLTGSSDLGSIVTTGSSQPKTFAFTTPQALTTSMVFVWVGFVFNMSTTQPTFRSFSASVATVVNTNLTAATYATAINGTSVTALANITPSSNVQTGNATPFWVGIT